MSTLVPEWLHQISERLRLGTRFRVVRRRFWRRWDEFLFVFDMDRDVRSATARLNVSLEMISLDTIKSAADLPVLELVTAHEIMRRLRRGDVCFVARLDGRVAAHCWTGYRVWNLDDIAVDIPLADDEMFFYDLYASPEFRGHRIFFALIGYLHAQNRTRGIRVAYARIRRRNIAAIAGPRFFGYVERLELNSMRILSVLRIYHAKLTMGEGRTLRLLTAERTRMGPGVLLWTAEGRSGYRINFPRGRALPPTERNVVGV